MEKCDFGTPLTVGPRFPARIESRTDVIEHREPKLKTSVKAKTPEGQQILERNHLTDGQETTDDLPGGVVKSKARWVGRELLMEATIENESELARLTTRWRLSDDGKTLFVARTIKSQVGETTQKLVLVKQT